MRFDERVLHKSYMRGRAPGVHMCCCDLLYMELTVHMDTAVSREPALIWVEGEEFALIRARYV